MSVSDPRSPAILRQQQSPYLNLIRFIPDSNYIVNGIFSPENKLVLGKIYGLSEFNTGKNKKTPFYKPIKEIILQPGRLPWDVLVIPSTENIKCKKIIQVRESTSQGKESISQNYQVIIPNAFEEKIQIVSVELR